MPRLKTGGLWNIEYVKPRVNGKEWFMSKGITIKDAVSQVEKIRNTNVISYMAWEIKTNRINNSSFLQRPYNQ
jgi:hypothetical protein